MEKSLFIDVRSSAEVEFTGLAMIADCNIPFMMKQEEQSNPIEKQHKAFIEQIQQVLKQKSMTCSQHIVLICHSGERSLEAATLLANHAFQRVFTMTDRKTRHQKNLIFPIKSAIVQPINQH